MGKMERQKGANFEREVVRTFKGAGIHAERRGGLQANPDIDDGDVVVDGLGKCECKRRKSIAVHKFFEQNNADFVIMRGDGKPAIIAFELEDFLTKFKGLI